ncbi:uncharacterized protein LOC117176821 [Belonocnema kinseyi]|uniref:uncharacterized protein LOC117176821 n=1 Tax=Belonocnema kinseyi TaxID=2817044 RepID=UPI00143D9114|nr:uncharacterized protein LOC117176821 [Belonocnema kinseyi]
MYQVCAEDVTTQTEETDALGSVLDMKNQLIDSVNNAIQLIREKIREVQEESTDYGQQLEDEALNIDQYVYEKIAAAQEKVTSALISKAVDVNVTECADMSESFNQASQEALEEVNTCLRNIIIDASVYFKNIIHSSEALLKKLTSIRDEAILCKSNGWNFYCNNVAAAKGTWAISRKVPSFIADIQKLSLKVSNFFTEMGVCSSAKGVNLVIENASEITKKIRECVKAQKAAADAEKKE